MDESELRQFELPYFSMAVDDVAGPYLSAHGFRRANAAGASVHWERARFRTSFSYYIEDRPTYTLTISIGMLVPNGGAKAVALWRASPDNDPVRGSTYWRFTSEPELRAVLDRAVTDALPRLGEILWSDAGRLFSLVAAQDLEAQERYETNVRASLLSNARRAFEQGQYSEALDKYVLLDDPKLSASDRKRILLAKRALGR